MICPPFVAIIDVAPDSEGRPPIELLRAAYCASRAGKIAFVLHGISPQVVDRVLDEVVASEGPVPGVVYCDADRIAELVSRLGMPRFAVASTESLQDLLATSPVRIVPASQALQSLLALSVSLESDASPPDHESRCPRNETVAALDPGAATGIHRRSLENASTLTVGHDGQGVIAASQRIATTRSPRSRAVS